MSPQFYVGVPNAFPHAYALSDTPPVSRDDRFEALSVEITVHSKMHGSHEKAQPYVVRGVARHGRLLVQTTVGTEYDPVGRWHEIDGEYTVEGYRFKRHVLKPMSVIIKAGLDYAKMSARVSAKREKEGDRAERCGTCPVCFGDYVVTTIVHHKYRATTTKMVHHGYQRPGIGYIVGDCHGVGFEPFEVSCEGTKSWLKQLQQVLSMRKTWLEDLDTRESIAVEVRAKRVFRNGRFHTEIEKKTLNRGEDGFDRAIADRRRDLEIEIKHLTADIATYTKKISEWKAQPWPRKVLS